MKRFYSLFLLGTLLLVGNKLYAQTGTVSGRVTDAATGQGLDNAVVALLNADESDYLSTITDNDGFYIIKPVQPGTYILQVLYTGYGTQKIPDLQVTPDVIKNQDVKLKSGTDLAPIYVKGDKTQDMNIIKNVITKEEIKNIPIKGGTTNDYAANTAGVIQKDDGKGLNVAGGRDYGTIYYVDGIKVRGATTFPAGSIEQFEVITGGLPAKYGDVTGAVINITTRGPSQKFGGGLELGTSTFLDPYRFNLISLNLSGPIIKPDSGSNPGLSMGYFITAEFEGNRDGSPSAVGMWKVKDDVFKRLENNPLRPSELASGFVPSAEFMTKDSLEQIKYKRDIGDKNFRFNAKLDLKINKNVYFTFGGNVQMESYVSYDFSRQIFSPTTQTHFQDNTYRGYVRFTQQFPTTKESKSVFSNAFYTIQLDYTKFYRTFQDPGLKNDLFNYGYIGKFDTKRAPIYMPGTDTVGNDILFGWTLVGYSDTLVQFTPANVNPLLTNYTEQFYQLAGDNRDLYGSLSDIQQFGGLINGQGPPSIYSLWSNVGSPTGNYGHRNNDQFRLTLFGSVDFVPKPKSKDKIDNKNIEKRRHAIQFGIEYEQRTDRLYTVAPRAFWTLARQLANNNILNLDLSHPHAVYDQFGVFQDTINYDRLVTEDQSWFDHSLREYLNAHQDIMGPVSNDTYINIDNLDPSVFDIGFFSPDELFQDGNGPIFFYGYDYKGNVLKKQPSFDDFFTKKDANDNFTREIPAFRPIYTAFYLQDKFSFRDLYFNIGVRIDRFDANQRVLKDKYLLYPTYTVGELGGQSKITNYTIPSTIGDDFVVYVNDPTNPSQILGYRNGDTWYNSEGSEITDPKVILPLSGKIAPYLKSDDLTKLQVTTDAFKDYEPQFTVMPRISFSFPISDEANFFAHYDVLSQRPLGGTGSTSTGSTSISSPFVYYYLRNIAVNSVIENPSLKPEKTIDYQVGFLQYLGADKNSSLTISGTYRELKNMVQVVGINYAYPINYRSFGNEDFGTVKSFQVSYDMGRTHNVKIQVNYTLQFADGTGSGVTSALNLINSNQPNQKVILPFDYDQRHTLSTVFDYRYASGPNTKFRRGYEGPYIGKGEKRKPLLENTGASVIFRAGSGTPYSRANSPTTIQSGVVQNTTFKGSRNGSHMPWSFKFDLKLDRDWKIGVNGKDEKGNKVKNYTFLNTYILFQNVFNTKNILSVYSYTGNPSDDGFLGSTKGEEYANQQLNTQSFIDLYSIKVNNPDNYSLPRRIKVGAILAF